MISRDILSKGISRLNYYHKIMRNQKKTLARKLMSNEEKEKKTPVFLTENWKLRAEARRSKVADRIAKVRARKIKRMAEAEAKGLDTAARLKKKITPAEMKQIRRKAKLIKFTAKIQRIKEAVLRK